MQRQKLQEQVTRYKQLSNSWESTTEALLVLVLAAVLGLFGGTVHCWEFARCQDAGTCANASRGGSVQFSCSFTNYVSVSGDVLYGIANASNYLTLTRSVCAPGERLHINSVTQASECAPWRAWPSALNDEIMSAEGTEMHDKMCGKWIEAGPAAPLRTQYWSFYDIQKANTAVQNADSASYSSARLAATDMGKFFSACQQAILGGSGAIRSSATEAYNHLRTRLEYCRSFAAVVGVAPR